MAFTHGEQRTVRVIMTKKNAERTVVDGENTIKLQTWWTTGRTTKGEIIQFNATEDLRGQVAQVSHKVAGTVYKDRDNKDQVIRQTGWNFDGATAASDMTAVATDMDVLKALGL